MEQVVTSYLGGAGDRNPNLQGYLHHINLSCQIERFLTYPSGKVPLGGVCKGEAKPENLHKRSLYPPAKQGWAVTQLMVGHYLKSRSCSSKVDLLTEMGGSNYKAYEKTIFPGKGLNCTELFFYFVCKINDNKDELRKKLICRNVTDASTMLYTSGTC